MSHDPRHIREANRRLSEAREERKSRRAEYERQCRERYPELDRLDRAIQGTVAQAIAAALQRGEDPSGAVDRARRENLALQLRRLELLREAGIDPQDLEDEPLCPVCGDTGWHGGKLCRCVTRLCVEENLRELGAQMALEEMDFQRFELRWYSPAYVPALECSHRESMAQVRDTCRDYAETFPDHRYRNLFLYGGTGLGKTLLSGCVARRVAQRGWWVVYATAGELLRQYEAVKFNRDEDGGAQEDLRRYENCDLLVLDDLGSEMTTPFVQSALYQLLNQRMRTAKHTIISSNLDMDTVWSRYVPQVASRLEGEYQELPFFGKDIRLQKKEERDRGSAQVLV